MNGKCLSHSSKLANERSTGPCRGTGRRRVLLTTLLISITASSGCASWIGRSEDEEAAQPQIRLGNADQPVAGSQDCAKAPNRTPGPTCFPPAPRNHWASDAASALRVPAPSAPGSGASNQ